MLSGLTMKTPNQLFNKDCAGHVLLTASLAVIRLLIMDIYEIISNSHFYRTRSI